MTRAEIAAALQHSPAWLYKNLAKLHAAGMPRPAFGQGRGARWSRRQFMAWLEGGADAVTPQGDGLVTGLGFGPDTVDPEAEAAARDRRARRAQAIGDGAL
jgi:hypothetical protein